MRSNTRKKFSAGVIVSMLLVGCNHEPVMLEQMHNVQSLEVNHQLITNISERNEIVRELNEILKRPVQPFEGKVSQGCAYVTVHLEDKAFSFMVDEDYLEMAGGESNLQGGYTARMLGNEVGLKRIYKMAHSSSDGRCILR